MLPSKASMHHPNACIKCDCNQVFYLSRRDFREAASVLLWLEINKHSQTCCKSVAVCWDSHLEPPSHWSLQNIPTSDNIPGANSSTCIWSTLALCTLVMASSKKTGLASLALLVSFFVCFYYRKTHYSWKNKAGKSDLLLPVEPRPNSTSYFCLPVVNPSSQRRLLNSYQNLSRVKWSNLPTSVHV